MNTPQRKQGLGPHHSKTDNIHEFCSSPCTSKNSSYQPSLDWMEEELARVCGEGSEEKSSPIIMSPQENPNSSLPIELSEKLVEGNSLNNNNIKPEIEKIQENNTAPSIKPLANGFSWRLLRKKNEAELERKLKKIEMNGGTEKRARLERRFTELFGPDDVHPSALNGKRKDREEIAALTVKHLMPMYKKQKIASKDLFKKLAKQISNCIMEKVDCPGENDVQSKVQELFANGKTFTSEVDIDSST